MNFDISVIKTLLRLCMKDSTESYQLCEILRAIILLRNILTNFIVLNHTLWPFSVTHSVQ